MLGDRRLLECSGMVGGEQHGDIESRTCLVCQQDEGLQKTRRHGGGTMR